MDEGAASIVESLESLIEAMADLREAKEDWNLPYKTVRQVELRQETVHGSVPSSTHARFVSFVHGNIVLPFL